MKKKRKPKKHKHQWRKCGGTYDSRSGRMITKKKCIVPGCKAIKEYSPE